MVWILPTPANAELQYKQVGVPNTTGLAFQAKTSNLPVYTMSKYGQGISMYQQAAIGLDAGKVIKEIKFLGWQDGEKNFTDATIEIYIANAGTSLEYEDFITAGEPEETDKGAQVSTTVIDTSKATLFYQGSLNIPSGGSRTDLREVIVGTNDAGFTYTGGNLMVFINISCPKDAPFTNFIVATQSGETFEPNGGYRDSQYTPQTYPGYSIYTKNWSPYSGKQMPVMVLGYDGERQQISATVTGSVKNGFTDTPLEGAKVTLSEDDTVIGTVTATPDTGEFSFNVADVNLSAVYTVTASCAGFETASSTVNLKAGGNVPAGTLVLSKLPVPATLSGKVINKATSQPIADAPLFFNDDFKRSAADGSYSFEVENVDLLPASGSSLTCNLAGFIPFSASIKLTGDLEYNVEMEPLPALPGEGALVGEYNVKDYDYTAPINSLWRQSSNEIIYPKGLLGNLEQGKKYGAISFYGYYNPSGAGGNVGDDDDYNYDFDFGNYDAPKKEEASADTYKTNLKVYMLNTDVSRFSSASNPTDVSKLTPLFEGEVEITPGGASTAPKLLCTLNLDRPFVYDGEDIKIIINGKSPQSKLIYFAMDPTYFSNILQKMADTDPAWEIEKYSINESGVPVMKLGDYVTTGIVSGKITDANDDSPLAGVSVTLGEGEDSRSVLTDEEGDYMLSIRNVDFTKAYPITISAESYNEVSETITFTEADFDIIRNYPLTRDGKISGDVVAKITQNPVEGVEVSLSDASGNKIEGCSATTDADGKFELTVSDVKYAQYSVTVSGAGNWIKASQQVTFSAESIAESVSIELDYGVKISGKVTFSDDLPVEGALIKIDEIEATTDSEGLYSLEISPVTTISADVVVTFNGAEEYNQAIDLSSPEDITYDIKLNTTALRALVESGVPMDVYTVEGYKIASKVSSDILRTLPAGFYIVNGKKLIIK